MWTEIVLDDETSSVALRSFAKPSKRSEIGSIILHALKVPVLSLSP